MKRTKEELRETIFKAQTKIEKLTGVTEEHKRRLIEELENRSNKIINEIKALQKEKEQLMSAPGTKEELLRIAIERYRVCRKRDVYEGLKNHLRACHEGNMLPFDADRIRDCFPMHGHLLLQFFVITEEEIKAAVTELEEGITEEEREKKITQIDKKIVQLTERLKKGL